MSSALQTLSGKELPLEQPKEKLYEKAIEELNISFVTKVKFD